MNVYYIRHAYSRKALTHQYEVIGSHKWGLPGVHCPDCKNTWGTAGTCYPRADLSHLENELEYRHLWPVDLDRFLELRKAVSPLVPLEAPAPPGTTLGGFTGRAKGNFDDVIWPDGWTVLLLREIYDVFVNAQIRLPDVAEATIVHEVSGATHKLLELEILHGPQLVEELIVPKDENSICQSCGRHAIKRPPSLTVRRETVPSDVDVFRLDNIPTHILVTQNFKDVVINAGLSGIQFEDVQVE